MDMVGILLSFIRSIREGNWQLYLSTFSEMLKVFAAFNHTNYTKWGAVFLADMKMLEETALPVYEGFVRGDFAIKETDHRYNQIPDDQAVEHVNRKSKVSGGLVGIINNSTTCTKWCLTCNDKAEIVDQMQTMLGLKTSDIINDNPHKDLLPSIMKK